ncbi:MAG: hypothetical protein V1860_01415 [bacterium]
MNLKQFLTLMAIGTVLCWAMFFLVIFNMEPSSSLALIFFYASLFLSLFGTLSMAELSARVMAFKKDVIFREVRNSFRQAILLSFLFITILFLQSKRLLAWWNIILLIMALTAIECLIVSLRTKN